MKRNNHNRSKRRARMTRIHRGVAMMLVLISLMTATVLTTSYVASRDNSVQIGDNAVNCAAARWSAESGLELGVAIMQTDKPWRTAPSGQLLSNEPIGGALVTLQVTDLHTGGPPDDNTKHAVLTSTADFAGVQQVARAIAHVALDEEFAVDVDLSDFAVFATSGIELRDNSLITRWPSSPAGRLGLPMALGTQATSSGSILLNEAAAAIDTRYYTPPLASATLALLSGTTDLIERTLNDTVPIPDPPATGVAAPLLPIYPNQTASTTLSANVRRNRIEVPSGGLLRLNGNITVVAEDDLILKSGSSIKVNGNVKLITFKRLIMEDNSSIEINDGSTLNVFVKGDASIRDAYIGEVRTNNVRDNTGAASYTNPENIKLYTIPDLLDLLLTSQWVVDGNSVLKAEAYLKRADVRLRNTSAVYGRIASRSLLMREQAAIFYDHGLDLNIGYTNPQSALYNADGTIKSTFKTLSSLSSGSLLSANTATGLVIKRSNDEVYGTPPVAAPEVVLGPLDPTPRTVPVQYDLVSFGTGIAAWEKHN